MSPLKTTPFDPAKYLDTEESIAIYMDEAMKTNDHAFIADAFGVCVRAYGLSEIIRETGLSPETVKASLRACSNPDFATVLKVAEALGLSFTVKRVRKSKQAA